MTGLPVPTPRQWVVGDTITAARLNAIRNAINFFLSPPMFSGQQSPANTQTVADSTWASLKLDSIVIDTYGGHSGAGTQYTCQLAGVYEIHGLAAFVPNAAGGRGSSIMVNGSRVSGGGSFGGVSPTGSSPGAIGCYVMTFLSVGDRVEVQGFQTTGAPLSTLSNSDYASSLSVAWKHS